MPSSSSQNSPEPRGLLQILFASVFALFVFRSFSKSLTPDKEPVDRIDPKTDTEEENNARNQFCSLTSQIPPSTANSENACKGCHHKTPRWKIVLDVGMLLATAGAFAAAGYYAHVSKKMWTEMQKQTGIDRDQLEATTRPWVKINTIELRKGAGPIKTLMFHFPPTGTETGPMLQTHVTFANVGHSVAQGVEAEAELFSGEFMSDKWHDVVTKEQGRFCDSVIDRTPSSAATIVFPSDPSEVFMGVGGLPLKKDSRNATALIICINYQGGLKMHYQTQAWAGLYEDNSIFIAPGVDVDLNRLRLIREANGDHAN